MELGIEQLLILLEVITHEARREDLAIVRVDLLDIWVIQVLVIVRERETRG